MGPGEHRSKTTSRNPLAHLKNSDAFSGLLRPLKAFCFFGIDCVARQPNATGSGAFWWTEPCRISPMRMESRSRAEEIGCERLHCFRH